MLNAEMIYQKARQLDTASLQQVAELMDSLLQKKAGGERKNMPLKEGEFQPAIALQRSGLMGCAEGPADLAENYKDYLGRYWMEKHDHR